jgi:hypothetical protein
VSLFRLVEEVAPGQTEKNSVRAYVFALPSNSDIAGRIRHVSNVPFPDSCAEQIAASFDDLVRNREKPRRQREAERFCCFKVDH